MYGKDDVTEQKGTIFLPECDKYFDNGGAKMKKRNEPDTMKQIKR